MRKALAAALISAFVFPGCGHLYLKRNLPGALFILASAVPSIYLMHALINSALHLFALLQKQMLPPDFNIMLGYILGQPFGHDTQSVYFCLYAVFFIWLGAMLDAYRIGYQIDLKAGVPATA